MSLLKKRQRHYRLAQGCGRHDGPVRRAPGAAYRMADRRYLPIRFLSLLLWSTLAPACVESVNARERRLPSRERRATLRERRVTSRERRVTLRERRVTALERRMTSRERRNGPACCPALPGRQAGPAGPTIGGNSSESHADRAHTV